MLNILRLVFCFSILYCVFSCSTSKNKFLNREYHALTTKYNVLFNGKEAFSAGKAIIEELHEDNFFEILPIEPITLSGENIEDLTIVPGFDRAEEKAVKAIQKHSMNIGGVQYNREIDEAYLLLGKARYFDRRFFPALDAFNFLLKSKADKYTHTEGIIWREKTNIRLKNNALSLQNLKPLATTMSVRNKFFAEANATVAQAYINLQKLDSAVIYLKRAAIHERKKAERSRYLFICGQLFEQLQKPDSARWAYGKIIALRRKAPRKFYINAKINKYFVTETSDGLTMVSNLKRMLRNYENEPYKHTIYRALGQFYRSKGDDSLTQRYFDLSLRSESIDVFSSIANYTDLIDFNFERGNYVKVGTYLDSLIPYFQENSIRRKRMQRKRDNLNVVIRYENVVKSTDSLLHLMSLTYEEQLTFFEDYIEKKKAEEREKIPANRTPKSILGFLGRRKTVFYFYNPNLVLQGKQRYRSTWGNRPNVDNWRNLSDLKEEMQLVESNEQKQEGADIPLEIIVETPENFVKRLPKTGTERDSLKLLNHNAYLQLGMIYKEKFKNYPLAINRLTTLLDLQPRPNTAVPALYHLYKIYEGDNQFLANHYKTQLIESYPETAFARVLSDPDYQDLSGIKTPESLYEDVLKHYNNQEFENVLRKIDELSVVINGSAIEPKWALLRANVVGRLEGIEAWKTALEEITSSFSESGEGRYAKDLLLKLEAFDSLEGIKYKNYKWIFPFDSARREKIRLFRDELNALIKTEKVRWKLSVDVYNKDYTFVVVHGIRNSKEVEQKLHWRLSGKTKISEMNNFVALSSEYQNFLINKTWNKTKKK